MRVRHSWALPALAVIACGSAGAQELPSTTDGVVNTTAHRIKAREPSPPPSLRVDVNRVFIPVTVTDRNDHQVQGLEKRDFRIFEDGIEQRISEFFQDETPVSLGVVLDSSNSMKDKIDLSRQAIGAFLRFCPPADEYLLVSVQSHPEFVIPFTNQPEEIEDGMQSVFPKGWTALFDGMYLAINHVKKSQSDHRALLVLSDGGDNNSRYSESEIRDVIRESGVRIFSVSVLGRSSSMERFSEDSGGRAFQVHKLDELSDLAAKVSSLVHGEYVLGFSPAHEARDGKYHTIKVQLTRPDEHLRVTWRHGYYAPVQ